ncbi:alpha/beta fold hydrolase, partial [Nocardioides hankookensis]
MKDVKRPALEGSVGVRGDRRLSFAEYGSRRGPAIVWMHGTPGARRQIPLEARAYAERHGLRLIGLDRPGIGSSTSHLYPDVLDWTRDLELVLETLAIDTVRVIGLSGGGPYALAAGAAL